MMLQNVNDATMCRVFPSTLTKIAQRWFHQLSNHSISSFEELVKKFRPRLITNVPPTKSINDLRACKQESAEMLRCYLDRFNKVAIQIEKLSDEQAIEALKNETCLGMLRDKINIKEPTTFSKAMAMATKLIKMDEDRRLRPYDDKATSKREERFKPRRTRPQHSYSRGPITGHASSFRKEVESYTPLNIIRLKVLMWIRENGVGILVPRRMSPSKEQGRIEDFTANTIGNMAMT